MIKKFKTYPAGIITSGETCQCPSEAARAVDRPPSGLIAPLVDAWYAQTVALPSGNDKPPDPIKPQLVEQIGNGFGGLLDLVH